MDLITFPLFRLVSKYTTFRGCRPSRIASQNVEVISDSPKDTQRCVEHVEPHHHPNGFNLIMITFFLSEIYVLEKSFILE